MFAFNALYYSTFDLSKPIKHTMTIDDLKALGWHAQEHVYTDAVTGARVLFYAIHKPDGKDTGAHGETEHDAWMELAWLFALGGYRP